MAAKATRVSSRVGLRDCLFLRFATFSYEMAGEQEELPIRIRGGGGGR